MEDFLREPTDPEERSEGVDDAPDVDELTNGEASVRDLCRTFAAAEIAPNAARWWQEERCPIERCGRWAS
jgi:hypothetical protein